MKRHNFLLVIGLLALVLAACGETQQPATQSKSGSYRGDTGPALTANQIETLRQRTSQQNF